MKRKLRLRNVIIGLMELDREPNFIETVVELLGSGRVLIEHHYGITSFTDEDVSVKTQSGRIEITGQGFRIARMGKEYILIKGKINQIILRNEGL